LTKPLVMNLSRWVGVRRGRRQNMSYVGTSGEYGITQNKAIEEW